MIAVLYQSYYFYIISDFQLKKSPLIGHNFVRIRIKRQILRSWLYCQGGHFSFAMMVMIGVVAGVMGVAVAMPVAVVMAISVMAVMTVAMAKQMAEYVKDGVGWTLVVMLLFVGVWVENVLAVAIAVVRAESGA